MSTDNHSVFQLSPSTPIHPGARPFFFVGGPSGVLLIHGYGGSIGDFLDLGHDLHQQGYTVGGLCLPGHGHTPESLAQVHMEDWREAVFSAARELKRHCHQLVIVGASFGGALAIDYAVHAPDNLAAVVVVNTALAYRGGGRFQKTLLKLLRLGNPYYRKSGLSDADRSQMKTIGSLERWPINGILETQKFTELFVRPGLRRLVTPLHIITTAHDPYVTSASAEQLLELAGSADKTLVKLTLASHRPIRDPAGRQKITETVMQSLPPT